jgi:hypothetical protein
LWLTFVVSSVSVPPDIINEESSADIAVPEGEDATLVCVATGHPAPKVTYEENINDLLSLKIRPSDQKVTWRREDGDFMLLRKAGSRELVKGKCLQKILNQHFLAQSLILLLAAKLFRNPIFIV